MLLGREGQDGEGEDTSEQFAANAACGRDSCKQADSQDADYSKEKDLNSFSPSCAQAANAANSASQQNSASHDRQRSSASSKDRPWNVDRKGYRARRDAALDRRLKEY